MKEVTAGIVFACFLLLAGSVVLSIVRPDRRIWPSPGLGSWQSRYTAILGNTGQLGLVFLGVLDWNGFVFTHWLRFAVGGALVVSGACFALWGLSTIGLRYSQGPGGALVTRGPYRWSRNPQNFGAMVGFAGYAVACNSGLALAAAGLAGVWFTLMPFAEEPHLRGRLGAPYEAYLDRVPRFLGRPR